jgi:hypothetical protein
LISVSTALARRHHSLGGKVAESHDTGSDVRNCTDHRGDGFILDFMASSCHLDSMTKGDFIDALWFNVVSNQAFWETNHAGDLPEFFNSSHLPHIADPGTARVSGAAISELQGVFVVLAVLVALASNFGAGFALGGAAGVPGAAATQLGVALVVLAARVAVAYIRFADKSWFADTSVTGKTSRDAVATGSSVAFSAAVAISTP